jgi:hypothetical protein
MKYFSMKARLLLIFISILLLGLQVDNVTIKSAYVCHLASFVKWTNPPENEFRIGIYGESPDGKLSIPADKRLFDKPVKLYKINNVNQAGLCKVIFVCADREDQINNLLQSLDGKQVLTISAHKGFLEKGMMVNLLQEDGRVVFELNKKSLASGNVQLSSKIYQLAKRIL